MHLIVRANLAWGVRDVQQNLQSLVLSPFSSNGAAADEAAALISNLLHPPFPFCRLTPTLQEPPSAVASWFHRGLEGEAEGFRNPRRKFTTDCETVGGLGVAEKCGGEISEMKFR